MDALSRAVFFEFIDEVVLDGQLEDPPPTLVCFPIFFDNLMLHYPVRSIVTKYSIKYKLRFTLLKTPFDLSN